MAQTTTGTDVNKSNSKDLMAICIENCQNTQENCLRAINYCLEKGGEHAEVSHIQSLVTCAITCRNSVELMSIDSDLAADFCNLCAEACKACAESCSKMDDEVMQKCAEFCRESEDSCRRMKHH